MKKLFLLLIVTGLIHSVSFAKIRRVGFFASPINGTDYATFALAYAAANSNDTILVFPNYPVTGTIAKKLFIVGTGNWLDPNSTPKGNANQQASGNVSTCGALNFTTGSAGSVLTGFECGNAYMGIRVSDITIKRNRNVRLYIFYDAITTTPITISNLLVQENYKVSFEAAFQNGNTLTNLIATNNFINYFVMGVGNTYGSGNVSNNIWAYDATLSAALNGGTETLSYNGNLDFGNGSFLFQNNILFSYTNASAPSNYNYFGFLNAGNSIFNYNVALQAGGGASQSWGTNATGNVIVPTANYNTIFQGFPAIGSRSADDRYILGAASPALMSNRAGSTADAGIYGGTSPYKLSTIPTIPSIYILTSPQGNNPTGSSIQINVGTRGNN